MWYKSIYTLSGVDRPTQDIIDDNQEVDQWYAQYTREISVQAAQIKRQRTSPTSAKRTAASHFGKKK